jgi:FAD synthetase
MKKVMCFGTFDILHKGHEYYLKEAKKLGDCLVVIVALDETVATVKKHPSKNNQETRIKNLQQLGIADKVILGHSGDKLKVVEEEKPDIICFGYDQKAFTGHAKEELRKRGFNVEVVRLNAYYPDKYKSSLLRKNANRGS